MLLDKFFAFLRRPAIDASSDVISMEQLERLLHHRAYDMQQVEGHAGPARHVQSLNGERFAILPVRPQVECMDQAGHTHTVPLPVARHSPKWDAGQMVKAMHYDRTETSPVYADVPWAVPALKHLAEEYDRMHAMGLGVVFDAMHAEPHRLMVLEAGDKIHEAQALLQKKDAAAYLYLQDTHLLMFEAKRYSTPSTEFSGNILVHELAHALDQGDRYSQHPLFMQALKADMALGRPEFLVNYIIGAPLLERADGQFAYRDDEFEKECFARLCEFYAKYPKAMQKICPTMTKYLTDCVLPDVQYCLETGSDVSPLTQAASQAAWQETADKHRLLTEKSQQCLNELFDRREALSKAGKSAVPALGFALNEWNETLGEHEKDAIRKESHQLIRATRDAMQACAKTPIPGAHYYRESIANAAIWR